MPFAIGYDYIILFLYKIFEIIYGYKKIMYIYKIIYYHINI